MYHSAPGRDLGRIFVQMRVLRILGFPGIKFIFVRLPGPELAKVMVQGCLGECR